MSAGNLFRLARSASRPLLQRITNAMAITGGIGSTAKGGNLQLMRYMSTSIPFPILRMNKDLELSANTRDKNFSFSPFSMQLALSLLANGASGTTLKELLTVLEAKDLNQLNSVASQLIRILSGSRQGPELSFAGGLWVDQSFNLKQEFKASACDIYKATAEEMDFNTGSQVIEEVNKWVNESTKGLITSILPPDSVKTMTKFVLANAFYFKGNWAEQFKKHLTNDHEFYLEDGSSVKVPFMESYRDQFIDSFQDFKVLRLPYKSSSLSMYIFLPNQKDGLWSLVQKMGSDPSFLEKCARSGTTAVKVGNFRVPKFEIKYELEASMFLKDIGLESCFSDKAEFTEMVTKIMPGDWIQVEEVYQKSYIKVNEEGTEAAAVTYTGIAYSCAPSKLVRRVDFVADHPFMFTIRDDMTGMVLFMGHVVNPLLE